MPTLAFLLWLNIKVLIEDRYGSAPPIQATGRRPSRRRLESFTSQRLVLLVHLLRLTLMQVGVELDDCLLPFSVGRVHSTEGPHTLLSRPSRLCEASAALPCTCREFNPGRLSISLTTAETRFAALDFIEVSIGRFESAGVFKE